MSDVLKGSGTVANSKRMRDKLYARFARYGEDGVRTRLITNRLKHHEAALAVEWLDGLQAHFEVADRWTQEKQDALVARHNLGAAISAKNAAWLAAWIAVVSAIIALTAMLLPIVSASLSGRS